MSKQHLSVGLSYNLKLVLKNTNTKISMTACSPECTQLCSETSSGHFQAAVHQFICLHVTLVSSGETQSAAASLASGHVLTLAPRLLCEDCLFFFIHTCRGYSSMAQAAHGVMNISAPLALRP